MTTIYAFIINTLKKGYKSIIYGIEIDYWWLELLIIQKQKE